MSDFTRMLVNQSRGPRGYGPYGGGPSGGGPCGGGPRGGGPLCGGRPVDGGSTSGGFRGDGPRGSGRGSCDGAPPPKQMRMTASGFFQKELSLLAQQPTASTSSVSQPVDIKVKVEDAVVPVAPPLPTISTPAPTPSQLTASTSSVPNPVDIKKDIIDALSLPPLLTIFLNSVLSRTSDAGAPPRPRTSLRDEAITTCYPPNIGSEAESDDDDELLSPFIPRVLKSALETPKDADDDASDSDAALAGDSASLNDFQWNEFPNPPISQKSRREIFSESNLGPTTVSVDPYDIFIEIWDVEFMKHIASETNRYAEQIFQILYKLYPKHALRWHDTTVDELYVYFGIIIAMGFEVKSTVEEYWSGNCDAFYTSCFSAHMDIDRFCRLNKYLHFSNNEDMCALGLDGFQAKLFKIQPLLSHLNKKFQSLYNLNQDISLDGSLLQWKGCSELFPKKAATMAIKTYEICESQTGYLWRFEVHIHKESPSQQTLSTIILSLVRGLEHKGYTLWMDSYYNSPCLARRLKTLGFDCAGTLRTNRKFVPPTLHSLAKEHMRRGQISGLTSGDVDVMVWRDQNRVAMISTYHANAVEQVRGSIKPTLILDYNTMLGPLDEKDQLLAKYPIELKRRIWYKKIFRRLLNVSVFNSCIIHGHYCYSTLVKQVQCSHRKFRMNLVTSLLAKHSFVPLRAVTIQQRCDDRHRVVEDPVHNQQRLLRKCTVCKQPVSSFCAGCKEFVCVYPCFLSRHS